MIETKREILYEAIEKYGLDYSKIIAIDNELHDEINRKQREIIKGGEIKC